MRNLTNRLLEVLMAFASLISTLEATTLRLSEHTSEESSHWSYDGDSGPEHWPGLCTSGLAQSPININMANVVLRKFDELIFHDYDESGQVVMSNNGHTEALQGFLTWRNVPMLSGGGLGARYKLREIHFHWAAADDSGSEHTLDRLHYPLEAHFVHIREDLNVSEASAVKGGSAVLAVFFAISDVGEPLQPFEAGFNTTILAGTSRTVMCHPSELLPTNRGGWFRYNGSFTTPTCDEVVTWTVLMEPIEITEQQLNELRHHLSYDGTELTRNLRGVQELNDRKVYMRSPSVFADDFATRPLTNILVVFILVTLMLTYL